MVACGLQHTFIYIISFHFPITNEVESGWEWGWYNQVWIIDSHFTHETPELRD